MDNHEVKPKRRAWCLALVAFILSVGVTTIGMESGVAEAGTAVKCSTSTTYPGCTQAVVSGGVPNFNVAARGYNYKPYRLVYVRITVYKIRIDGGWTQIWWDQRLSTTDYLGRTPWLTTWVDCSTNIVLKAQTWYSATSTWAQQPTAYAYG